MPICKTLSYLEFDLDLESKGKLKATTCIDLKTTQQKQSGAHCTFMLNETALFGQLEELDKDFILQAYSFCAEKMNPEKNEQDIYDIGADLFDDTILPSVMDLNNSNTARQLIQQIEDYELPSQLPQLDKNNKRTMENSFEIQHTGPATKKRKLVVSEETDNSKTEESAENSEKKVKQQPCIKFVPEFITKELEETIGEGRFTSTELMTCLLFGYTESLKANSYATIKQLMGNKRSRGSIRRKIEKIVKKETGINGGLLGIENENQKIVLESLWKRFMKLANETENKGSDREKEFSRRIKEFAVKHCKIH